jgi:hypothetical protein
VKKISELPVSYFAQLAAQPLQRQQLTLAHLNGRYSKACIPRGTSTLDPNVSPPALDELRKTFKQTFTSLFRSQGASATQIECFGRQVDRLSNDDLRRFGKFPATEKAALKRMVLACGGHI